jgi:hypothetical protein
MKYLISYLLILTSLLADAQGPLFNKIHPVSCQWPEYNYTAQGSFENVFLFDGFNPLYDSYLLFGNGVLCHPDSVTNYTRCFSAKCNSGGDLVWWRRYETDTSDISSQWFNAYQGNYGGMIMNHEGLIASTFTTFVSGDEYNNENRDYLTFIAENGQIVNSYLIDSTLAAFAFYGLIEDLTDSTYVGFGWYRDSLAVVTNTAPIAFLLKMDSMGNQIWLKSYPNTLTTYDVVKAMDGGFWICATTPSLGDCGNTGSYYNIDLLLIKTDALGNTEDIVQYGGACSPEKATVHEYEEDRIVLAGYHSAPEIDELAFEGNLYTTLIDQNNDETFSDSTSTKNYLYTLMGSFTDFLPIEDGGYFITGSSFFGSLSSIGEERHKGFILRLDENRDSLWLRSYLYFNNPMGPNGLTEHYILDSKLSSDGGLVCCGWIQQKQQDPSPLLQTPWLFKVDSLGCLEPGCQFVHVSEIVIGLENAMSIFPNPVSDVAHIVFSFPENFSAPQHSELVVLDMQGKEVSRHQLALAGAYNEQVELQVTELAAGIYTIHWVNENQWLDSVKLVKE